MTDQQNPTITPPRELVQQWMEEADTFRYFVDEVQQYIAARASHWGYDQRGEVNEAELQEARDEELEACIEVIESGRWFHDPVHRIAELRAARRPKPPSLKKQALMALEDGDTGPGASLTLTEVSIIRRALEALPDD